jgi:replicative DNA helicase
MALNIVGNNQQPVGFFSLEMSSQQLVQRLLSTYSKISSKKIQSEAMDKTLMKRLADKNKELSTLPLFIDDSPGISILEIRARARRLKNKFPNLAVIFVDYLQLIHGEKPQRGDYNRQQEVTEISRVLKELAREINTPVVALSQLSRLIERRKGKDSKPKLSDLRESGALEQDADIVMFIHRDLAEQQDAEKDPLKQKRGLDAELIVGKHRNGPIGTIPLLFFPDILSFNDAPKLQDEQYKYI